jgi:integrase
VASVVKRRAAKGDRYDVRYRTADGGVRTKTFSTRRDAQRFGNAVETDKLRGSFVDPRSGRITLAEYSRQWVDARHALRPRTRELYEAQLRGHILPALGRIALAKLTPQIVRRWHSELARHTGASTVAKCYRLLRAILATAVSDELLARNPCRIEGAGVEHPAERPTATIAEVWELARAVKPQHRCLVLLAGFCGLRLGELLALEQRHVNLLHGTVRIEQQEHQLRNGALLVGPPKSEAGRRTIALPPPLVSELERQLAKYAGPGPQGRLFLGESGGPLRRHVWQKDWSRARGRVDLPGGFHFHDLRHTANTLTAASGASTAELMRRMGHASSEAALRYQHASQDRDRSIAEALGEEINRDPRKPQTGDTRRPRPMRDAG